MYDYGQGVAQDNTEAVYWYKLAAEQGYAGGQNNLGVLYYDGLGVEQNPVEAVRLFREALHQGEINARKNLGRAYYEGKGVRQNYFRAFFWAILAQVGILLEG